MEELKKPKDEDWRLIQSFATPTIEEAIAHLILGTQDDKSFIEVSLPDRLKKDWSPFHIIIEERITSKMKWDEIRINRRCNADVCEILDGKIIESYNFGSFDVNYLLASLPSTLTKIQEALPYGFRTSEIAKNDPVEYYPYFLYEENVYKSTYYFHSHRCICGDLLNPTKESSSRDENTIKLEVFNYNIKFFEKNRVYVRKGWAYYEDRKEKFDLSENDPKIKSTLRALFPLATWYDCYGSSGSLAVGSEPR